MRIKAIALAASLALASTPAMADPGDWSSDHFEVMNLSDSCVLIANYGLDGRPDVQVRIFTKPSQIRMLITSPPWSVVKDQDYDNFDFFYKGPDKLYTGSVTGFVDNTTAGFSTAMPSEALDAFAQAQRLTVLRAPEVEGGEPIIVADFGLRGSSAAVTALKRCTAIVTAQIDDQRRREARYDHIARDPFARPTPAPETAPAATASGVPVTWSRQPRPGFPARAQELGMSDGEAKIACDAAADGTPENCTVLSEEPPAMGFGREALLAVRSSRFSPATARSGGRHEIKIRFSIG